MDKINLTIFQPAYRVNKWEQYLDSIAKSCTRYKYDVVFCGPNKPEMKLPDNVFFIHDEGSPARCANIASKHGSGELVLLGSDDALFVPNALDNLLDYYYVLPKEHKLVCAIKYGEAHTWMAEDYWRMTHHPPLRLAGISDTNLVMLNSVSRREYWIEMGGYDCSNFNTCNFGGHDLTMRFYNDRANIQQFKTHIMMCEWTPGTKDHSPIVKAEEGDYEIFKNLYDTINTSRGKIDIDNYKLSDDVWKFAKYRA